MDNTGTIFRRNIIHTGDDKRSLVLIRHAERHQLFVFPVFHVAAFEFLEYLVFIAREHFSCQTFRDIEDITLVVSGCHAHLDIVYIRTDGQRDIGSQCPRGCRPREKIFIVGAFFLKFASQGVNLYHLISLRDFVRSQTGSATRAIWQDLVAFIDQSHIKGFFENPPAGFDVIIIKRDIRVIHVSHICHAFRHLCPQIGIGKN